jgi:hypothetical protein
MARTRSAKQCYEILIMKFPLSEELIQHFCNCFDSNIVSELVDFINEEESDADDIESDDYSDLN